MQRLEYRNLIPHLRQIARAGKARGAAAHDSHTAAVRHGAAAVRHVAMREVPVADVTLQLADGHGLALDPPARTIPSHCVSCGQTRPQMLGSELSAAITSAAAATSPFVSSAIKAGMFILTGQASTQRGRLHARQRDASRRASSSLYP